MIMTYSVDVSANGADAQVILPAVANTWYVINRITYSYSGNITIGAGNLLMKFGEETVLDFDLKTSQDHFIHAMQSNPGETVTITLDGITLLQAKLSVSYDTYTTG